MKKILITLFFLLSNCSNNFSDNSLDSKFNFSKDLTMNQFINKLKQYSDESSYPDLND